MNKFKPKPRSTPSTPIPQERCAHCYRWSVPGMMVIDMQGGTTFPLCDRCAKSVGWRIDAPEVQKRIRSYITERSSIQ